ncbi:MAG: hypothetical protein R2911_28305 [Caldilineaceae bacterium]
MDSCGVADGWVAELDGALGLSIGGVDEGVDSGMGCPDVPDGADGPMLAPVMIKPLKARKTFSAPSLQV